MAGNLKWNLITGLIGFAGTLALSMQQNIIKTAFVQSLYSFVFLFLITFLARWFLGLIVQSSQMPPGLAEELTKELDKEEATRGLNVDLATPDDTFLNAGAEEQSGFAPLNPPKLSTALGERKPEDAVRALRQMTDE